MTPVRGRIQKIYKKCLVIVINLSKHTDADQDTLDSVMKRSWIVDTFDSLNSLNSLNVPRTRLTMLAD